MSTLFHFTSEAHLPVIMRDGALRTTESNAGFEPHAAPDCVWLTTSGAVRDTAPSLAGSAVDKTAVRFTVAVPDGEAVAWRAFCGRYGVDPTWRRALERTGGAFQKWRMVFRAIPRQEWTAVEVRRDGIYVPVS